VVCHDYGWLKNYAGLILLNGLPVCLNQVPKSSFTALILPDAFCDYNGETSGMR